MIAKTPGKQIEFGEQDELFVKQLAKDIGCHYCKANIRTYSLNKNDSAVQSEKGTFAWVHKEEKDYFWVATRKIWLEAARSRSIAGKKATKPSCFLRDTKLADDSVALDTKDNYQKTVSSLKLINKMR
jgi:hypothetical protein